MRPLWEITADNWYWVNNNTRSKHAIHIAAIHNIYYNLASTYIKKRNYFKHLTAFDCYLLKSTLNFYCEITDKKFVNIFINFFEVPYHKYFVYGNYNVFKILITALMCEFSIFLPLEFNFLSLIKNTVLSRRASDNKWTLKAVCLYMNAWKHPLFTWTGNFVNMIKLGQL